MIDESEIHRLLGQAHAAQATGTVHATLLPQLIDMIDGLRGERYHLRWVLGTIAVTTPQAGTAWFHAIAREALENNQP